MTAHQMNTSNRLGNCWMSIADFNRAITNSNPKRDRAHAIAAEVRARRPEMQVKRITKGQP